MINQKLLIEIQAYIEKHQIKLELFASEAFYKIESPIRQDHESAEINDFINKRKQPSLQQILFSFINKTRLTDPEVYKKAGLDRKLFSKIRSNPNYKPSKNTVLALAIALELNKKDANKLLNAAGYSLSESDTRDLIIQFFIEKKIYNFEQINEALHELGEKTLIG